jgi:hypothetical protein
MPPVGRAAAAARIWTITGVDVLNLAGRGGQIAQLVLLALGAGHPVADRDRREIVGEALGGGVDVAALDATRGVLE